MSQPLNTGHMGANPMGSNINMVPGGNLPGAGMIPAQTQNPSSAGPAGHEFSYKSKNLLGMLKVAVENVIEIATKTIIQNSAIDNGSTLG